VAAFELIAAQDPASKVLFLCDHASAALPEGYGSLGLDPSELETHIAYDIGASWVARRLAGAFGAALILGRWSRLLVDLNRGPCDPSMMANESDGRTIPANRGAGVDEVERRIREFHQPYHEAIERELDRLGPKSAIFSIHSFTPSLNGVTRPWEVGVIWDKDGRLAVPLMEKLSAHGFIWGNNEPYSGALEEDCLTRHGTRRSLPNVLIEIRQDLLATRAQAEAFAERLYPVLREALDAMEA
jgi:predicted N-formylglutamate amidohydrolase